MEEGRCRLTAAALRAADGEGRGGRMRGRDAPPDWSGGRHRKTGGARQGVGSGRGAEQTSEGVLMGETGPQLGVGVRAVAVVVTVTGGPPEGLMVVTVVTVIVTVPGGRDGSVGGTRCASWCRTPVGSGLDGRGRGVASGGGGVDSSVWGTGSGLRVGGGRDEDGRGAVSGDWGGDGSRSGERGGDGDVGDVEPERRRRTRVGGKPDEEERGAEPGEWGGDGSGGEEHRSGAPAPSLTNASGSRRSSACPCTCRRGTWAGRPRWAPSTLRPSDQPLRSGDRVPLAQRWAEPPRVAPW